MITVKQQISSGWISCNLEDCSEIHDAIRKPVNNEERQIRISGKSENQLFPYYGATGQVGYIDDYLFDGEFIALGEDGVPFFDPQKHKAYLLKGKTWVNNHAHVLKGASNIDNRFLCYQLNQIDYQGYVNGATRLKLTQQNMRRLPILLPPLNEQIRIADKLDSLLAKVDEAQARLDKIPTLLKRFRQSVLAAATSGELTREWRAENGVSFETWGSKTISDITTKCFDGPFGSKLKTADYTTEGVKVARLENIGHLEFLHEKETFISKEKFAGLIGNKLEDMDILFSSFVDEEVRTCIFRSELGTYINKADCFCLRTDLSHCLPKFLVLRLACKSTFEKVKGQVHGATRPRINLRFLKSLTLNIPSIQEQTEIVRRVESLFTQADAVEQQYLAAKQRLNRLSQALLAKAFRGELVPQDPNDEPAAELLKRIQAERQPQTPAKRQRSAPI